jgi:hypothetical protein
MRFDLRGRRLLDMLKHLFCVIQIIRSLIQTIVDILNHPPLSWYLLILTYSRSSQVATTICKHRLGYSDDLSKYVSIVTAPFLEVTAPPRHLFVPRLVLFTVV